MFNKQKKLLNRQRKKSLKLLKEFNNVTPSKAEFEEGRQLLIEHFHLLPTVTRNKQSPESQIQD